MTSEKLNSAIAAIKSGDNATGSRLLAEILKGEPSNESAWLWLSFCVDDIEKKKFCLKNALSLNPNNPYTAKELLNLEQPPQSSLEDTQPINITNKAYSTENPIPKEDKSKITATFAKPVPSTTNKSSPVKAPPKTPTKKKVNYFVIIVGSLVVLFCGICLLGTLLNSDSSTSSENYLSIGDKGILYNGKDEIPVAVTKEVFDQVIHMSTSKDTLGYTELIIAGLVFHVNSGTQVLIIDSEVVAKQVRILDGEYMGASGWVPVEWVKK
jgi:hypothetical protein